MDVFYFVEELFIVDLFMYCCCLLEEKGYFRDYKVGVKFEF